MEVAVFAADMVAEFQSDPLALVILDSDVTETVVLTRYAVPVSVLWPVAEAEFAIVDEVNDAVGEDTSIVTLNPLEVSVAPESVAAAVIE
jgi:hypothetical protein